MIIKADIKVLHDEMMTSIPLAWTKEGDDTKMVSEATFDMMFDKVKRELKRQLYKDKRPDPPKV